jgi:hypothetical protein
VSFGIFALVFVAGASLLAFWVNVRLTKFVPSDLRGVMLHIGVSLVACQLLAPAISSLLVSTGSPVLRLVALIGVALPALTYALLSIIWVIGQVQGGLRNGMMR